MKSSSIKYNHIAIEGNIGYDPLPQLQQIPSPQESKIVKS